MFFSHDSSSGGLFCTVGKAFKVLPEKSCESSGVLPHRPGIGIALSGKRQNMNLKNANFAG